MLRKLISPAIDSMPMSWSFNDRVVAWLLPNLRGDVKNFHQNGGPSMVEIFQTHQLASIDQSLVRRLASRAERLRPGIIGFLQNIAADVD